MTKAKLLDALRAARQEWESLLHEVGGERMTIAGATGYWSVKDVITHLTYYARWYANAAEAQLRGEMPPLDGTEQMPFDARNHIVYERCKDMPLAQALRESAETHQRLLAAVEQLPEAFLIEPQTIPDSPQPAFVIWKMLRGDVYDHTRTHIQGIRAWLAQTESGQ